MSKLIYEVVHGNGEYKAADGSMKTRWQKVGVVFESEKGNKVLKLDAIPTKRNDEGELWLNLFVPQDKKPAQTASQGHTGGFRDKPVDTGGPHGVGNDEMPPF